MAKDTFLNRKQTLNCQGKLIDLSKPLVMAVLNITPDSFYAGSRIDTVSAALVKTAQFITEGANIIDIGSYSSRPHAEHISSKEEIDRLLPYLQAIKKEFPDVPVSVDTFRAEVAREAVLNGANIVNDIGAGNLDTKMFETIADLNVPYIMMHMKGTPQNMQENPHYTHLSKEVYQYFDLKIKQLHHLGIKDIVIDPGFGFAKTLAHNYELLNEMELLQTLGQPIIVGFSRKSMIYKALQLQAEEALNGTTVLNTIGLLKGANILRVHDVKEAVECIKLVTLMRD